MSLIRDDEPEMDNYSDDEIQQDDMFDPNFVDDFSLPQRPQEQAVWEDDRLMNIDPNLDPPPTERHFQDTYESILGAQRSEENEYGIDPYFGGYHGYDGHIDGGSETAVENMNGFSPATVNPQEVAPTYGFPDELQQLNDFAQPQQHGLPPGAFELSGANAEDVQWAVDQQTSMTNLPPSIQIYNPDGQLITSPTSLPQDQVQLMFDDPTISLSLFPELQDFLYLNDEVASNNTTLPELPVQDQQLLQIPSSSSSQNESSQSWLLRHFPHLSAATMASSGNGSSSPSSVSTESITSPMAQDLDLLVGLYDDDPPLNPSPGTQATAENSTTRGSSGPNSGQNSTQDQANPEQPIRPVNAGNLRPNFVQNLAGIGTPHQTEIFSVYIVPGPNSPPEANCLVEHLTPARKNDASKPVLFLHGDHHTGQTWKYLPGQTQTNVSWVDHFLQQGYTCYVPDMPMSGRSMGAYFVRDDFRGKEQKVNAIEGELTSPRDNLFPLYDTARYHCQFPGAQQNPSIDQDTAGLRYDPYFLNYKSSRVPIWNTSEERVAYGAEAVSMILDRIGEPTIIIAEGSGGVSGLIAADRFPEKVAGLILMGYPYAPFAMPFQLTKFDNGVGKVYHNDTMEECTALTSGLTSTDLHFDPPLALMQCLNVVKTYSDEDKKGAYCFLQDADKPVRKLVNVAKVPVLVVTPEAGKNSAFDWSIVSFLRQAGVDTEWYKLARFGLLGNGQLMWMEKNGQEVAKLLQAWIVANTTTTNNNNNDVAAAAAILAVRPDQVALADRREEEVRGITAREAARYETAVEERRRAWARREIAPLVQANADAMECFYSWLPVLDLARADFQAAQAAAAAAAAGAPAAGSGAGAAAAP
ncbi:uncharacterized protein PgNI_07658 [Pyricularia grisea]|uniref:AB hydrolase-1 domain-containing protein n=1 Tax=Pyricularia grisea TaxID=148305 RepID=A0A6P8AZW5_PYRGI|nr:uncharacterized protein PgNI_07658 [Pyricularia grisea]TLD08200.1 hypothetical protein PgNI_07658 [Pyricularia grisea]